MSALDVKERKAELLRIGLGPPAGVPLSLVLTLVWMILFHIGVN